MFRISSQPPQITTPTATAPSAQGGSANQLQTLMHALEEAIQRLTQQFGGGSTGTRPGGGDRLELPHREPARTFPPHREPARTGPTPLPREPVRTLPTPLPKEPVRTFPYPNPTGPVLGPPTKWPSRTPDDRNGDSPGKGWGLEQACGGGAPGKGPTGGTLIVDK